MTRLIILAIASLCPLLTRAQIKIFYDDECRITLPEMATHYRLADVDVAVGAFTGKVRDYWMNDAVMTELDYDSGGFKDGRVIVFTEDGDKRIEGRYISNKKAGVWTIEGYEKNLGKPSATDDKVDVLDRCFSRKERFEPARFIRKKDYRAIQLWIEQSYTEMNERDFRYDVPARFPEDRGFGNFRRMFQRYPEEAEKNGINGSVEVEFTVFENGTKGDYKVLKGLGYGCDEEAVRFLKLLPDWLPACKDGKPIVSKAKWTVSFGISEASGAEHR